MSSASFKSATSGPTPTLQSHGRADAIARPEMPLSSLSTAGASAGGHAVAERPRSIAPPSDSKSRRFTMMRLRHASDPQLSTRFKAFAEEQQRQQQLHDVPPLPPSPNAAPAPVISYTSPKRENLDESPGTFRPLWTRRRSFRTKSTGNVASVQDNPVPSIPRKSISDRIFGERSPRPSLALNEGATNSISEKSRSSLALPFHRFSSSSTSDEALFAAATTTYSNASTTTTFFKIPRRKKNKQDSLFPLPAHLLPSKQQTPNTSNNANTPQSAISISPPWSPPKSPGQSPLQYDSPDPTQPRPISHTHSTSQVPILRIPTPNAKLAASTPGFANPGIVRRNSTPSVPTSPSMGLSLGLHWRKRSGTFDASLFKADDNGIPNLPPPPSGRTSVASVHHARNSIGGLKALTSRLRYPSESHSPRNDSPGGFNSSQSDSAGFSKETLILPDREDGETAGKYYSRLDKHVPKRKLAVTLSKSSDTFNHDVLRSLMRSFKFYEVPLDIAIRQFLWEIDLPGEAQQIDRVISAFAERYHECNPHIFRNFDQVYLVAYSLIILHSDLFNKNNKRKMQKSEYQRNTGGHGIDDEILGYFYDNIQYTEFIAQDPVETDFDNRPKARNRQSRIPNPRTSSLDTVKPTKSDPYDFIVDAKAELERLRPSLQSVMNLEDTYSFFGTGDIIDIRRLREAFARYGTLEIVSARSRPDAFAADSTIQNPYQASPGLVAIRVVKVGLIWRKDVKRRKTQRSWQQWGAVLTASQLYFFRNYSWVRGLMSQFESHQRIGSRPLVFRPPLEEFKPDLSIPIPGMIALLDSSYDKHKNAFLLARQDEHPYEETLIAENEAEMNDWLAKLNYAAAFHWDNLTDPIDGRHLYRTVRSKVISSKLAAVEQKYPATKEKLEDNLRNARHLQILVPFPTKTRSELLSYGARIGVRVRWSRYAAWRLQCEHFMLTKGLEIENTPTHTKDSGSPLVISSRTSSRPGPLSRWNSKASALVNPQRSKTAKAPAPASQTNLTLSRAKELDGEGTANNSRPTTSSNAHDHTDMQSPTAVSNVPHALSTPSDAISERVSERPTSSREEAMGSSGTDYEIPAIKSLSEIDRGSINDVTAGEQTPPPEISVQDEYNVLHRTPSTIIHDPDFATYSRNMPGSPDSRKNRRSMPRTLRESKDLHGTHQHKIWKGKDSVSSMAGDEVKIATGNEKITRGSGSFTVHGKKASVVTLSPEWQHLSAEERLRSRRETVGEEMRPVNVSEVDFEVGAIGLARSSSAPSESNRTSYHSVLEDLPSLGSDLVLLDYPGPQSPMPQTTEIDPGTFIYDKISTQDVLGTSSDGPLYENVRSPKPERPRSVRLSYGAALRTFLEDASMTDEDSHDVNERVGIALGEP